MYRVIKGYTDPFTNLAVKVGDVVEIPEEHLKGYKPYVEPIETAELEPEEKAIVKKRKKAE